MKNSELKNSELTHQSLILSSSKRVMATQVNQAQKETDLSFKVRQVEQAVREIKQEETKRENFKSKFERAVKLTQSIQTILKDSHESLQQLQKSTREVQYLKIIIGKILEKKKEKMSQILQGKFCKSSDACTLALELWEKEMSLRKSLQVLDDQEQLKLREQAELKDQQFLLKDQMEQLVSNI